MFEPLQTESSPRDALTIVPVRTVSRVTLALAGAGITAATLIGMLLGLGRRYSTLWRPLNAAAHTVLGTRADGVWGFQADVTLTGVAVVLVMSAMTGVVIAVGGLPGDADSQSASIRSSGNTLSRVSA